MISGTLYKGAPGKDAGGTGLIPWPPEIAPTLDAHFGDKQGLENQHINGGGGYIPSVAKCLITKTRLDMETETMIVLMDQGGGIMNVLDDGTVGTLRRETHGHEPVIIQPIALAENTIGRQPLNGGNGDGFTVGGPMYTLNATGVHGVAQPIAFAQNTRDEVRLINGDGQIIGALAAQPGSKQTSYVATAYAFDSLSSNSMKSSNPVSGVNQVDVSKTLDTSRGLDPSCNQGGLGLVQSMAVRRLTPVECEALQGFPKNYTNIPWRKKEESPDGPRYKALGNSMAVPVMHWIGKRIADAP
jgi:DNA (cytosine-5)-methyltransferase 1